MTPDFRVASRSDSCIEGHQLSYFHHFCQLPRKPLHFQPLLLSPLTIVVHVWSHIRFLGVAFPFQRGFSQRVYWILLWTGNRDSFQISSLLWIVHLFLRIRLIVCHASSFISSIFVSPSRQPVFVDEILQSNLYSPNRVEILSLHTIAKDCWYLAWRMASLTEWVNGSSHVILNVAQLLFDRLISSILLRSSIDFDLKLHRILASFFHLDVRFAASLNFRAFSCRSFRICLHQSEIETYFEQK